MNTHDTEHHDDELKALLDSLPQPAPSSALDAAILADAEKALDKPAAANDSADGVRRTLPAKKSPDYLQRWRVPLGLAAAVLLTVNLIGVDWFGSKPAQFPVVGEPVTQDVTPAPVTVPAAAPATESAPPALRAMAKAAPRMPAQAEPVPAPLPPPAPPPPPARAMREAMEQQAAMQAEAGLQRPASVQRALAMPAPAPVAARSVPLPPPARLDASVWLVKIDALLKAGEGTLAHEEWTAFRQAYPDYPVAEELRQRLEMK
ncbi:hypothetical protein BZG29_26430 [Janthinobacterium sp. LM6]|uniref:hypothetical protein n=1 Tax=Janthinobacterium sp. LM6 TaxID=1938606 RepID=UPI000983B3E7|nr:hypothetical protein [Janthinobacterium sp. LM6]AQR71463.1 hypothetical protein BZG29_26430 [Janthinobacterium sp. LM6]